MPKANHASIAEKAERMRLRRDPADDLIQLGVQTKVGMNRLVDTEQLAEIDQQRSSLVEISVEVINDLVAPATGS
jgi:hypothetical protein